MAVNNSKSFHNNMVVFWTHAGYISRQFQCRTDRPCSSSAQGRRHCTVWKPSRGSFGRQTPQMVRQHRLAFNILQKGACTVMKMASLGFIWRPRHCELKIVVIVFIFNTIYKLSAGTKMNNNKISNYAKGYQKENRFHRAGPPHQHPEKEAPRPVHGSIYHFS